MNKISLILLTIGIALMVVDIAIGNKPAGKCISQIEIKTYDGWPGRYFVVDNELWCYYNYPNAQNGGHDYAEYVAVMTSNINLENSMSKDSAQILYEIVSANRLKH